MSDDDRIIVRDLDPQERRLFASSAAVALVRGRAFLKPKTWPHAVFVVTPEERPRVTSRADFCSFLRANDLGQHAREIQTRRVKHGELLAYVVSENSVVIVVLDLNGALT